MIEKLKKMHIFAYPSIWPETSCVAAIEAMAAGCETVTTNLGALYETCSPFGTFVNFDRNLDSLEKRDGIWAITHRHAVYDWNRLDPSTDTWIPISTEFTP